MNDGVGRALSIPRKSPVSRPDPYRDKKTILALLKVIADKRRASGLPSCRIMEVCGTHTMAIHRYGLKTMLQDVGVGLVAGPGCPVCITPNDVHEAAIRLVSERENLLLSAFGDMTRVPTKIGSLQKTAAAPGSRIQIVYSPADSLESALRHPDKEVVFFGAGFETTVPAIALTAAKAVEEGVANYSVLTAFWLIPPPLRAILESGRAALTGFFIPATFPPSSARRPMPSWPKSSAGRGPSPALNRPTSSWPSVRSSIRSRKAGPGGQRIRARRRPAGKPDGRAVMARILEPKDAVWRGLGRIPASGLALRPAYAAADAEKKYGLKLGTAAEELPGCRCGDVLKGLIEPPQCRLFGRTCTPERPRGPCMVSPEGSCLAFHKYGTPS